jgi:hypothetical protein
LPAGQFLKGPDLLSGLLVAFILSFTVATFVGLGIMAAYGLVSAILFAFAARSRPAGPKAPALVPSHTQAGGD